MFVILILSFAIPTTDIPSMTLLSVLFPLELGLLQLFPSCMGFNIHKKMMVPYFEYRCTINDTSNRLQQDSDDGGNYYHSCRTVGT